MTLPIKNHFLNIPKRWALLPHLRERHGMLISNGKDDVIEYSYHDTKSACTDLSEHKGSIGYEVVTARGDVKK